MPAGGVAVVDNTTVTFEAVVELPPATIVPLTGIVPFRNAAAGVAAASELKLELELLPARP